jgi:excisionase family DNA binding protein
LIEVTGHRGSDPKGCPFLVSATNSTPCRRYAKIIEAAEYLGVTDRTIRDMILDGRLTGYRNGTRLVRVDLNELDARMQPFGGAVQ